MEKRYEKDPINGKFYEVKEKGFTDSEWQEFQERWGQVANKHKYSFADKVAFWFFGFLHALSFGAIVKGFILGGKHEDSNFQRI